MIRYRHISIPFSVVGDSRQSKDLPKALINGNGSEKVLEMQVKTYSPYEFDCTLSIGTTENGTDILDSVAITSDYNNTISFDNPTRVSDFYFTLSCSKTPSYGSVEVIF
tara:strand:- start:807 stop:1133 length:327 start_codon:yes stop_codon:yes gene_type:complete